MNEAIKTADEQIQACRLSLIEADALADPVASLILKDLIKQAMAIETRLFALQGALIVRETQS